LDRPTSATLKAIWRWRLEGDGVVVDQTQGADSGRREIEGCGRADAAKADQAHAGGLQPLLPGPADLEQHQMTGVAFNLVVRKGHASS
jgi:hypothetical protein